MSRIVIFGAGGRAGKAAVAAARDRGHQVTAVVRDPDRHGGGERGDVTDPASVARVAAGHDAAIAAVFDPAARPDEFYPAAARALLGAGLPRLIVVGLASVLDTADGVTLMDTPGYPREYRSFYLGHQAGVDALRGADPGVDWLVVSPAGDFDSGGTGTGRYRVVPADAASRISYADLAVALLDEVDTPRHHRTHIGVEGA